MPALGLEQWRQLADDRLNQTLQQAEAAAKALQPSWQSTQTKSRAAAQTKPEEGRGDRSMVVITVGNQTFMLWKQPWLPALVGSMDFILFT